MESLYQLYKIGHGPSSSHTMGPEAACKYVLNNYKDMTKAVVTLYGSLALTGKGHLTDYIIYKTLESIEVEIKFNYYDECKHPNTMKFELYNAKNELLDTVTVYSIGGGSIEIEGGNVKYEVEHVYPFNSFDEIKKYCKDNNMSLADVVYKFDLKGIKEHLENVFEVMRNAIKEGLAMEGELPGGLHVLRKANQLYESVTFNESDSFKQLKFVSGYAYAVSEQNASGGLIVTAPTCGASGVLPAVIFYLNRQCNVPKEKLIDALAVAGLIGNIIKRNASISGSFAGCQSEVGSACSMAAAAVAYIHGQALSQIEYAAEIALEHHLGLTCDPVNGLVQIPCIERNAVAALSAIDAANLAFVLDGTRKIRFDTVVKTMYETGKDLHKKYKETSIGGLAKNYKN